MSEVKAFPSAKHRKIVDTIARRMAERPSPKEAEKELLAHLQVQWNCNAHRGIDDEENERDVIAFADAVQVLLSADQVVILDRAVATVTGGSRRSPSAPSAPRRPDPVLHVEIALPKAKVMLLPGRFRRADHVRHHVDYVLTLDAERGEQHVQLNLRAYRLTIDELGVEPAMAEREVRRYEGMVRAELWRRILLPGGDQ
jgi:hypothetical protein